MPDRNELPLVQSADVVSVEIDGEVVVYDPDTGRAHLLSASGSLLWPALSSPATPLELAEDVADVFGLDPADAFEQVAAFCDQLVAAGLLEPADETAVGP